MGRLHRTAIALGMLLLAGCGFQLQGVTRYPPELSAVYLDVPDANSDLAIRLRGALAVAEVPLVNEPASATATVAIVAENYGRRIKTVSAQNRPTEYEVYYTAAYQVTTPEQTLVPRQNIARARVFSYSDTEILSKQQEEQMLRDALAREIAGVITRRLGDLRE